MKEEKVVFAVLCLGMFCLNGFLEARDNSVEEFLGRAIGFSVISIPLWSSIGVILANIGIFFINLAKPHSDRTFNLWHKASLGLIVGIVLKPIFNIVW